MHISYQLFCCLYYCRYSLSKEESDDYVLCDVIGCVENQRWRTECVRVVGDDEKPLLLQSLWKPREGFARRFEIQHKATVEENNSKDKDTVTAGKPHYNHLCTEDVWCFGPLKCYILRMHWRIGMKIGACLRHGALKVLKKFWDSATLW